MSTLHQHSAVPFWRVLRVEITKAVDYRGSRGILIGMAALAGISALLLGAGVLVDDYDPSLLELTAIVGYATSLLIPVLVIMLVTQEWSQRTGMNTFCLEPNRAKVLLAKLLGGVLLSWLVVLASMVLAAILYVPMGWAAGGFDFELSGSFFFGFLAVQAFFAALSFGYACFFLNTPAAIIAYFISTWIYPIVLTLLQFRFKFFKDAAPYIDYTQYTREIVSGRFEGGNFFAAAVCVVLWVIVPIGAGLWRIMRAEVK